MELSVVVERGFALGYLVCGVSLVMNAKGWRNQLKDIVEAKNTMILGFLAVFLGAFMVVAHNIWEVSPRVITTVIGWLALAKGALYLTFPEAMLGMAKKFLSNDNILRVGGLIVIAISFFIIGNS